MIQLIVISFSKARSVLQELYISQTEAILGKWETAKLKKGGSRDVQPACLLTRLERVMIKVYFFFKITLGKIGF